MEQATKQNIIDLIKEVKDRSEKKNCELNELQYREKVLTGELNYLENVLSKLIPLTEQDVLCKAEPCNSERKW